MEFLGNAREMKDTLHGREMEHPKGYYQPGVLAVTRENRILYRWRVVPTRKNIGGALGRSTPEHVWARVQGNLEGTGADAAIDSDPPLDSNGFPWSLFVALNLASGWFVNIGSLPDQRHIIVCVMRLIAFVAAWIAGFIYLPVLPVAVALVGWMTYVTPKVRWLSKEIQNEKDSTNDPTKR